VIDLRLAALLAPQDSSCLPVLQQAVVLRQQQQQQRAQPGQALNASAGAGVAAAPPMQPERVVALSVMRQFLQLLDETSAGQGLAAAAAASTERTHVLDALNQLQQALSALQRVAAGALQDPASDAKTCLAAWVADNLGLPPQSTSINAAVARLALLL
jgi:hypothetical protein